MAVILTNTVRVRARYMPKVAVLGETMPAYLVIEHLNGKAIGELTGPVATRMRKDLKLECRVWTEIDLGASRVIDSRKKNV